MSNNAAHTPVMTVLHCQVSGGSQPLELPALSLSFPCVALVPHCCLLEADVLFLLLSGMENVGSLVPCVLRMLPVAVCSQAR